MKKFLLGSLFTAGICAAQIGPNEPAPPGVEVPEPAMFWPILVIAIGAIAYRYYKQRKSAIQRS